MTIEDAKEVLALAGDCNDSLLFFSKFYFKKLRGNKWVYNWHQDKICKALEDIEAYKAEFLNINIPPRYSKTELVINHVARSLGKNPSGNFLYITASDDLRGEVSTRIRDIVGSDWYKAMYGVELKKDQSAKNLWRTTQGGGLKTATIFGQITGFGAGQMVDHEEQNKELADYLRDFEGGIILDDINKVDDAEQQSANNHKVTRVIFNTILSRKNSSDTPLINIQQRSGRTDATAVLLEHYGKDSDKVINLVLPIVYDGKPLWEWKHNQEAIEQLRDSPATSEVFNTQYMQDPSPKKGLMYSKLQMVRDLPEGESVCYIDYADKGKDYLCAVFANLTNNGLYIKDVIYTKQAQEITEGLVVAGIMRNKVNRCVIESNNGGRAFSRIVKEMLKAQNWNRTIITDHHQSSNKEERIKSNSSTVVLNVYFCEGLNALYMNHMKTHSREEKNENDDAPDATTGLVEHFFQRNQIIIR